MGYYVYVGNLENQKLTKGKKYKSLYEDSESIEIENDLGILNIYPITLKQEVKNYKFSVRRYGVPYIEVECFVELREYRDRILNSFLN